VLSEAVDALPRPARWLLRVSLAILKAARVFIALQAVGGLVAIVAGAVTADGTLAMAGVGQVALACAVFALPAAGSEHVTEVTGPQGAFVVRAGARRRWRSERGLRRLGLFVTGDRVWVVDVRRREDDPFGPPVTSTTADAERAALAQAEQLRQRLRRGEDGTPPSPAR
jgi:hypothetical protein